MVFSWSKITERLYTGGGIENIRDVATLVNEGVTHVIDARADKDDASLLLRVHPTLIYLWNPTEDDGEPKPTEWFDNALQFGIRALSRPSCTVFCHCSAGVNRGPSLVYTIMRAQGWCESAAKLLIHRKRPETQNGIRYANDAEIALRNLGWTASSQSDKR